MNITKMEEIMKTNILVFNSGYPPAQTYGGPSISIRNMVQELCSEYNFHIICNSYELDGSDIKSIESNTKVKGLFQEEIFYLDSKKMTNTFIEEQIDLERISMIYVNSFFNAKQLFIAMSLSKKYDKPLLIAPRGELEKNALALKKTKKRIYLNILKNIFRNRDNIYFQATTKDEEKNIKEKLLIRTSNIVFLNNIPSRPNKKKLYNEKKETNKLKMCFISRIQTKKNLHFALECLKEISPENNIEYDIYGPIENNDYWKKCLKIINSLPRNIKVTYKGTLNNRVVQTTFSRYQLFFFPTLSENFGHVIYESLAAGCPILISDQTPWTDINDSKSGKAFPLNNKKEFISYIEEMASMNDKSHQVVKESINAYLSNKIKYETMKNTYLTVFETIINKA